MTETHLAVFKGKKVRRTIHNNEWWFSVIDIVEALTDSNDPKQYIKKMRQRDSNLDSYWGTICTPLDLPAPDGKIRQTNCANTESIFRIIQSIPSPKAEPFKRWLAKVGYERIQEIEDPELATKRTRALYKAKGYPNAWIEKRMRGIAIREELTDEWNKRGVKEQREYAILTAEISKAAFGMTPGEASTTEISRSKNAQGFPENKDAAQKGGKIAGNARENLEKESGKRVSTRKNYLTKAKEQRFLNA
jgi:hypothetical protein